MSVDVEPNVSIFESATEPSETMETEKVNIKFGSHDVDEPVKGEVKNVSMENLPKDVVDEWPEPKQIFSFYIVRYRAFEDQNLRAKLDAADNELQKKNRARLEIVDKLRTKRADRAQLIAQIRSLSVENKQFRTIMDEKRKEMEPLHDALGKLRGAGGGRERGSGICSSEEELNSYIKSLQSRIQHESIPLSEEKQILREIKQLEGTRDKVIAHAAERARIQDSLGEKDAIQGQVKLIGVDLDGVRKEKQVVNAKLKQLDEEKLAIEKEIGALEGELTALTEKRDKTFEGIKDMRKLRGEGNSPFIQNRMLLTKAKTLAANKDVNALKELSETEVEKFMTLWNSNKDFRDDYERRIFSSLSMKQTSRDGRLQNPDEKPRVLSETSEAKAVNISTKQTPKEVITSIPQGDSSSEQKKTLKTHKEGSKKTEKIEEDDYFTSDKSQNSSLPKKDEVDETKSKELKREEEITKRIQAEERKKKLAEKAAAKAAIRAQKEAEKKLKEREKKARKKSGVAVEPDEATEVVEEVVEAEKIEEKTESQVPQKTSKDKSIRQRPRPRGQDSLPKTILKRKKATNYWVWAAAAAATLVILLVGLLGYAYLT